LLPKEIGEVKDLTKTNSETDSDANSGTDSDVRIGAESETTLTTPILNIDSGTVQVAYRGEHV
jgi:hypothetical protein